MTCAAAASRVPVWSSPPRTPSRPRRRPRRRRRRLPDQALRPRRAGRARSGRCSGERRARRAAIEHGRLDLDPAAHEVRLDGAPVAALGARVRAAARAARAPGAAALAHAPGGAALRLGASRWRATPWRSTSTRCARSSAWSGSRPCAASATWCRGEREVAPPHLLVCPARGGRDRSRWSAAWPPTGRRASEIDQIFDYHLRQIALVAAGPGLRAGRRRDGRRRREASTSSSRSGTRTASGSTCRARGPACRRWPSSASPRWRPAGALARLLRRARQASSSRWRSRWRCGDSWPSRPRRGPCPAAAGPAPAAGAAGLVVVGHGLARSTGSRRGRRARTPAALEPFPEAARRGGGAAGARLNGLLDRLRSALGRSGPSSPTPRTSCARRSPR